MKYSADAYLPCIWHTTNNISLSRALCTKNAGAIPTAIIVASSCTTIGVGGSVLASGFDRVVVAVDRIDETQDDAHSNHDVENGEDFPPPSVWGEKSP